MSLLHFLAVFASATPAQSVDRSVEPAFSQVSGAFFAVSVADLDSSLAWYSEKLGLQLVMRMPPRDGAEAAVVTGNGLTVELIRHERAAPLSEIAPQLDADYLVHGQFKAGITVDDLEATQRILEQRGVEIAMGPYPARPDQPANFIIRDNSGNYIQFFGR